MTEHWRQVKIDELQAENDRLRTALVSAKGRYEQIMVHAPGPITQAHIDTEYEIICAALKEGG